MSRRGGLVTETEVEAIRGRILALASYRSDRRSSEGPAGGAAVFLLVVAATFPVVLPFVLFGDVGTAKSVSRAVALAMLFRAALRSAATPVTAAGGSD